MRWSSHPMFFPVRANHGPALARSQLVLGTSASIHRLNVDSLKLRSIVTTVRINEVSQHRWHLEPSARRGLNARQRLLHTWLLSLLPLAIQYVHVFGDDGAPLALFTGDGAAPGSSVERAQ